METEQKPPQFPSEQLLVCGFLFILLIIHLRFKFLIPSFTFS